MMKNTRAFTLVELVTVVTIIALLGAVAANTYRSYSAKSKWGEVQACLTDTALRLENYRANHGLYPDTSSDDVDTVLGAIGMEELCGDHYKGDVSVFDDNARYIIAFCDVQHNIWSGDLRDVWVMVDQSPEIIHYTNPTNEDEVGEVPDNYLDELPTLCDSSDTP